jgi:hypothetical protein
MPAPITLGQLHAAKALPHHAVLFEALFGKSVLVTPEGCAAVADKFPWRCAAQAFFSPAGQEEFEQQRQLGKILYLRGGAIDGRAYNEHVAIAWALIYNRENLG